MANEAPLSRREREILDLVFERGEATAVQVRERMNDPPSYSAVRGLIRVLEEKGHLTHRRDGVRNVYRPTRAHKTAGRSALKRALETFFGGDVEAAVLALVDVSRSSLDDDAKQRLRELIEAARQEGR
ncbi:MAG: BlaI/MecI/CopY family transcriptional regulator [Planctomycetes bacterium]|nr:BlaI/MecI/CopY family transcriptional regulator [Planctomycetota bacterium]